MNKMHTDCPRNKEPQMLNTHGVNVTNMIILIMSPRRLLRLLCEKQI